MIDDYALKDYATYLITERASMSFAFDVHEMAYDYGFEPEEVTEDMVNQVLELIRNATLEVKFDE